METAAYIMLHGKKVLIKKIHTVESCCFAFYYTSHEGEVHVKIKNSCLEKALEFCEKRALFRRKYGSNASTVACFDRVFRQDLLKSKFNLVDLIIAAGRLRIYNLINLLFHDVVRILCLKTPEEVEKIFKIRYINGDTMRWSHLDFCLWSAPPCPTLSKEQQEEIHRNREEIVKFSPADIKNQPPEHQQYWVHAHLVFKRNTSSKQDAAADEESEEEAEEEEEESKVPKNDDDVGGPGPRKRKMAAYIMLHGKPVFIEEIYTLESRYFEACLATSFNGEIPIKIKSRYLQKALEFCEERAQFRSKHRSLTPMVAFFDRKFLKDVRESDLDLIDLIHAAGSLGINNLVDLLFNDVFRILCSKTPEQLEKIFKVRCNTEWGCYPSIKGLLDFAPPCPTLSKDEQEDVKRHLLELLRVSPAEFKTLHDPKKQYWVYAHLMINWNPAMFITTHQLLKEDATEDDEEEEESKVHDWLGFHPQINFNSKRKMVAYIMLHGKPVLIEEIHLVESRCFSACLDTSFDGEIPIKIKSRCLEKALEFCEKRPSSPSKDDFDLQFLKDVRKCKLDLIDLIHAAGRLGINNLVDLLFNDVVRIVCSKTPEQVEKIFKVYYNGEYRCYSLINEILDFAPPCPTLFKKDQEDFNSHREEILEVSCDDLKYLSDPERRYWVYAHLAINCNPAMFIAIHEDAAEDEEEEEESKQDAAEEESKEEEELWAAGFRLDWLMPDDNIWQYIINK